MIMIEIKGIVPVSRLGAANSLESVTPAYSNFSDYLNVVASEGGFMAARESRLVDLGKVNGELLPIRISEINREYAEVDFNLATLTALLNKMVEFAKKLVYS
jgi:hypothetical protein